ncbi:Peroxisomal acyl-coenzyme A oxidase 1 [Teratosphaeria destructans]|uniref:Acyl-coenzyme A oxidase n=1 Tax=Teratosphaeria destructans TaxID=418781 RepID=A0A9W7SNV3_9PEZI|nr:Peroxisomal acyl-coenzyme A oxidase 1 [Teratosphaeria destructans]
MSDNHQTQLMDAARARGTTDTTALIAYIHGGSHLVKQRREACTRYEDAAGLSDIEKLPPQYVNTSREDLYRLGWREGRLALQDMLKHNHTLFDNLTPNYNLTNLSPFGLSTVLIKPTLQQMGTPEQKEKWLVPTEKGQINWAYAQTELGHGTFVRGLETTATFDESRDSFVINSPTITSAKYWPGSLAFSATHAVVMARLITKGKDHGVHAFALRLRYDDGRAVEGIELGDIGIMSSYNQNDNGYAIFHDVVVPRDSLLMARSSITKDGTYVQPKHSKASYTTMTAGRLAVTRAAMFQLAQAVTIAIRYSTVREQGYPAFSNEDAIREVPLMHYKTQQHLLLPALANAYAMLHATRCLERAQRDFEERQATGDYGTLGDLHALSSGIKAWSTEVAFNGATDARRACGGHGYLGISNLPNIAAAVDAFRTLEGDNTVVYLQVARWLVKLLEHPEHTTCPPEAMYLLQPPPDGTALENARGKAFLNHQIQLDLFQTRSTRLLNKAIEHLHHTQRSGKTKSDAWNQHTPLLLLAARAHITTLILQESHTQTTALPTSSITTALAALRSLFALSQMASDVTFTQYTSLSDTQHDDIAVQINELMELLTPEAIALTDAWGFSDASLASAIGMGDGDVYGRLMRWTRQLPMNVRAREGGGLVERGGGVVRAKL